ncbi:hypothetical protein VTL71DRAFT_6844 [Oculimacula yallundae]|uniref:Ankyrin repeat protein n=1 Tax=Oculimacula yallundae TaxID=86028 RepID=A0ABR4BV29_9HELO
MLTIFTDQTTNPPLSSHNEEAIQRDSQSIAPSVNYTLPPTLNNRDSIATVTSGTRSIINSGVLGLSFRQSWRDSGQSTENTSLKPPADWPVTSTGLSRDTRRRNVRSLIRYFYPQLTAISQTEKAIARQYPDIESYIGNRIRRSRRNTLDRDCCNLSASNRCDQCGLQDIHYQALDESQIAEACSFYEASLINRFGNTPLHFVAQRSCSIFNNVQILHKSGARLSTRNLMGQTFLYALNPEGLGSHAEDIPILLEFVKTVKPAFDMDSPDHHGRHFAHRLLDDPQVKPFQDSSSINRNKMKIQLTVFYLPHIRYLRLRTPTLDNKGRVLVFMDDCNIELYQQFRSNVESTLMKKPKDTGSFYDALGNTELISIIKTGLIPASNNFWGLSREKWPLRPDEIQNVNERAGDLEMRDQNGEMAVFVAKKLGHQDFVPLLLDVGAKPLVENYSGTSLLAAASQEHRRARKTPDWSQEIYIRICMFLIQDKILGRGQAISSRLR